MPGLTLPSIPDHVEVTLRIAASLVLANVLTLASFPAAVPPSQTVVISSISAAFTMVLPTLLFSIGSAAFPGMVVGAVVALLLATLLLAVAATGGRGAYVAAYFGFALIMSGLRFGKAGGLTSLIIMLVSLNTMGLAPVVEVEGLGFVGSLWTESGTTNPNAVFRNSIIGMCWAAVCISFARLIPPSRTARAALSRKLLPKVLKDIAGFIRLTMKYHAKDDQDDEDDEDREENESDEKEEIHAGMVQVVQDGTITIAGGVADLTAFEPRLVRICCRRGVPADVLTILKELTNAVNNTIFSSLMLRAFSRAGFKELQDNGLGDIYKDVATSFDRCAEALATLTPLNETLSDSKGDDPETTLPFDPLRLIIRAAHVERLTNEWVGAMGPVDHSSRHLQLDNKVTRKTYLDAIKPWIMGGGVGLILAMFECIAKAFSPSTWRRIVNFPYYDLPKFVWCLKFAIGFTALVCMNVYWDAFGNLEIQTSDEIMSAHFAGWQLIAYAFSTTQTVEGTWKKGTLRLMGTAFGGFSAWLALTACGSNPYGLGVWMTITSTIAAYLGLPKGFRSRFGLDKDLAWGPAYFAMTQTLVIMEVYWGYGGKNDITANRIAGNAAGIAMALFMAAIPPCVYGGSPRDTLHLLEDYKRVFRSCIELMLEGSGTDAPLSNDELKSKLNHLYSTAKALFISEYSEADANYKDADQLQRLCILKLDPKLRAELDYMAVLGSSILGLLRFGVALSEIDSDRSERFVEGSEERAALQSLLAGLQIADHDTSGFHKHHRSGEGREHNRPKLATDFAKQGEGQRTVPRQTTFAHFCSYLYHYILHREANLDEVSFGFVGKTKLNYSGEKSKVPAKLTCLKCKKGN